jgi:drug/metabolite transporter (DMT)-like permease
MKLFSAIIKLTGGAILLVAVLGFICGLFDYVLVIKGSELPLVDGAMAIVLGVVGVVLFGLGWFMEKRAEKKDPEIIAPQLDVNNLQFIERALKRTRRRSYIIGICLIAFAAFMIWIPFVDPEADPSSGGSIALMCFAGLVGVLGLFIIYRAAKLNNIQDSYVYKLIITEPQRITGLDGQITRSVYTKHSKAVYAHLSISTKKVAILAVSEAELELLRQYLVKHNPNLQFHITETSVD